MLDDYKVTEITITKEDFEALQELLEGRDHGFYNSSQIVLYTNFEGAKGTLKAKIQGTKVMRTHMGDFYGKYDEYTHVELKFNKISMTGTGARTHMDGRYPHMVLWLQILDLVQPVNIVTERETVIRVIK